MVLNRLKSIYWFPSVGIKKKVSSMNASVGMLDDADDSRAVGFDELVGYSKIKGKILEDSISSCVDYIEIKDKEYSPISSSLVAEHMTDENLEKEYCGMNWNSFLALDAKKDLYEKCRIFNNERGFNKSIIDSSLSLSLSSSSIVEKEYDLDLSYEDKIEVSAIMVDYSLLFYASDRVRNNKALMLKLVKINARTLEYMTHFMWDDFDVISMALSSYDIDSMTFKLASRHSRVDRKLVMIAVESNGMTLKFVGEDENGLNLINDREVVERSVASNIDAIQFSGMSLRNDADMAVYAIKNGGVDNLLIDWHSNYSMRFQRKYKSGAFEYFGSAVWKNEDVIVAILVDLKLWNYKHYNNKSVIDSIILPHADNENVIMGASVLGGGKMALSIASERLTNDIDIVVCALNYSAEPLAQYIGKRAMNNHKVVIVLVQALIDTKNYKHSADYYSQSRSYQREFAGRNEYLFENPALFNRWVSGYSIADLLVCLRLGNYGS